MRTNELKETVNQQKNERRATSPRPSGFPSPPRVSFPRKDVRFAKCGPPEAERETEALGESVNQFC
jgi:hypothetical protein